LNFKVIGKIVYLQVVFQSHRKTYLPMKFQCHRTNSLLATVIKEEDLNFIALIILSMTNLNSIL
jgi:hypothetical protein